MRYVICSSFLLCLVACAKKKPEPDAQPFAVANMTCTSDVTNGVHETFCATADGVTQALPDECSASLGVGGSGVPLDGTGRTSGVYYTVESIYDCGVRAGQRCVFITYANGWEDMRCDDAQLP